MIKYALLVLLPIYYYLFPEQFSNAEGMIVIFGLHKQFKSVERGFREVTGARAASRARQSAEEQSRISRELQEQTAGLREGSVGLLEGALRGEDPLFADAFTPQREFIEGQFGNLRESIISGSPARGGQLTDLLMQAQLERVGALSRSSRGIRQFLTQQAMNIGFGTPQISLQGLFGAGQTELGAGNLRIQSLKSMLELLRKTGEGAGEAVSLIDKLFT